ncbi:fungalysin/thermolysin propeptide [Solirubrobacter pauli]|uniref:Fungalysin/thermolysin propeptide n=1 Tax=Solirubrobacter pauli TaxID=166793 RepID=A0A660LKB8_9ACTN|nr:fungalysin/thermolysin propeptide [Solirubrobacter pauli]
MALALPAFARAQEIVDLDPATDTVRVAARLDGALTRPASGTTAAIGLRYVREHRAALGLTAADLQTLGDAEVETFAGIRQVRWRQAVDGIEVADAELRVSVANDGRVLNVLGSPSSELPTDTTPALPEPAPDAELKIYDGRLAYRYRDVVSRDAIYDVITDADTGKVLKRTNLVRHVELRVWDNHPSLDVAAKDFTVPSSWGLLPGRLESSYMHVYSDRNANNRTDAGEDVTPGVYGFQDFNSVGVGCETGKPCGWNGEAGGETANREQNAVQAFYHANRFREWLATPPIGFDGFSGDDKLLLETIDGEDYDNANMYTPPEGESPRMQMFLWGQQGSARFRSVNSGDDASILFHEYAHGLTSRLVTDPDGYVALNTNQAGAMGEGWSDFYAKDYLVEKGIETDSADPTKIGEVHMGVYMDATPNKTRYEAIDCPVGTAGTTTTVCPGSSRVGAGGFTYGDFAKIYGSAEVHADGEIWAQTLWDLRRNVGAVDARRLITRALVLSPPEPSFLDMRNAILQAAETEALRSAIWQVFAARGMGFYASTVDGNDTAPLEDFSLPPAPGPRTTITGRVTDSRGTPAPGVKVSVGGADILTATTDADGRYVIADVEPRTYKNVLVGGAGFNPVVKTDVVVGTGGAVVDAVVNRDWAARQGGAKVVSDRGFEYAGSGCGPNAAFDGLRSTTWSTLWQAVSGWRTNDVEVELPVAINLTGLAIDPSAGCFDSASSALGQYAVETASSRSGPWAQVAGGTFTSTHRNKLNPIAATASNVRYVRLRPISSQASTSLCDEPTKAPTPERCWLDVSQFSVYGAPLAPRPVTTLDGPSGTIDDETPTFTFSSDQAGAGFRCRLDADAFRACTSPYTTRPLGDGETHTFEVEAVNAYGDSDLTSEKRTFTVQSSLPNTQLLTTPGAVTRDRPVRFTFSGNGNGFACSWDGAAYVPCESGTERALDDGPRTFAVRAENAVGADPSPATYAFIVDTAAPVIAISRADVVRDSATFGFETTDATAVTVTCALGGAPVACESPRTYSGLADGAWTFTVTATDAAGNRASASRTVVVDVAPPDTLLTWVPPAILTARDFQLAFTATKAATFLCSLDGAVATPCTSPLALSGLSEGGHSVVVTAVGETGTDPTPARVDFTVVIPGLPPAPSPTPPSTSTPRPTPTATPKRTALSSASSVKTVSRRTGRVTVKVRGTAGAKVVLGAKVGSRVVGKATRTLRATTSTVPLTLDKKRLKVGATVTITVKATGAGMTAVTRSLKIRVKA